MEIATVSQQRIRVEVDFFDAIEREKLLSYPSAEAIKQIVGREIDISTAEFLTYYLFHRKRLGSPGYRSFETISQRLHIALAALDECLDFNGNSICTPKGVATQLVEVTEHVGEAIGLAVVNRVHGLTEADWTPIPQQRGRGASRTFDFQIASDGHHVVQVENKGSSVPDNRVTSASVKAHRRDIAAKKQELTERARQDQDPFPASLRYGTIAVVDSRRDGNVKCLLTDPEPERIDEYPRRQRLLKRVYFLREWIAFISPRSQLASALATRVTDLEHLEDFDTLDRVPLLRGTGEPFEFSPYDLAGHTYFMANKSRVSDSPAGGHVLRVGSKSLFFVGIREELLSIAAGQSFERILNFTFETATVLKRVACVLNRNRFNRLGLPRSILGQGQEGSDQVTFQLEGQIHYSPSGLVFGALPL